MVLGLPCKGCQTALDAENTYPSNLSRCKSCILIDNRAYNKTARFEDYQLGWLAQNPRKHRGYVLKLRYGITIDEYEAMLAEQGGGCAGCGSVVLDRSGRNLAVDHDHETGLVRGLLCQACNSILGRVRDNASVLRRLADYLDTKIR